MALQVAVRVQDVLTSLKDITLRPDASQLEFEHSSKGRSQICDKPFAFAASMDEEEIVRGERRADGYFSRHYQDC